ncbi:UDP-N-acetylmuramoyl-tripeptide--D-alanyl-D-alanine ligase [Paenibacillus castaneae]|uniref:UDP-N-acetylmuramoyl-tripeptide--D-alanyl-D- alanine ligase n=1 Tax=Paenibacillus castaneae TaxID=474957 RepID=UPI000C9BC315|nr:UDP-N-acetylmuramoyl-tripeptide--D-alanyl-D-alanine ligase [Paenibacillus castaneae]NIK80244.1 UDP-N-acetylmuramoyl-tripeptide--D-alanyl-D-alanine ligase [Paenibacillus castaneae]
MITRSIEEIIKMAGGSQSTEDFQLFPNQMVHGVSIDSRTLTAGNLYIPIVRIDDGHKYVKQAFEKGAVASLWQKDHYPLPEGVPLIVVDNTLEALQRIAKTYRSQLNSKVIGITGSNGKTTVKDMVASLLSTTYKVQKTQGNLNGEYGLPLTLLEVEEDTDIVVLEMGMSNRGEIKVLSDIAKPDIGIITMIGVSHMSSLGSREAIAEAKLEILEGLNPAGTFIYNGDEPLLVNKLARTELPPTLSTLRFGQSADNEYYPLKAAQNASHLAFSINRHKEQFRLPLLGSHNISNVLAAIAAADLFHIHPDDIQSGLANVQLSAMRMERIPSSKGFLMINDAWNASPASMKAAIESIVSLDGFNKKVLVLGDMLELGDKEIEFHANIAQSIDPAQIHTVYTFGTVSQIITDILRESTLEGESKHFTSKDDLAAACLAILDANDLLLVKGSRGLKLEDICNILK